MNEYTTRGNWVYVLVLENGKYYVGSTSNLAQRVHQHLSGNGSRATKRSKPQAIITLYPTPTRRSAYLLESYLQYLQRHTHGWKPPMCCSTPELTRLIVQAAEHKQYLRSRWERRMYKRTLMRMQMAVLENSVRMS